MQVNIGIQHSSRELNLETSASQDEVLAKLAGAATKDVILSDDKGRQIFIPAGRLAYVELGQSAPQRVGFGV